MKYEMLQSTINKDKFNHLTLTESTKAHMEIQDVSNVIGIGEDNAEHYRNYVSRLDPHNKRDAKIIEKIRAGN